MTENNDGIKGLASNFYAALQIPGSKKSESRLQQEALFLAHAAADITKVLSDNAPEIFDAFDEMNDQFAGEGEFSFPLSIGVKISKSEVTARVSCSVKHTWETTSHVKGDLTPDFLTEPVKAAVENIGKTLKEGESITFIPAGETTGPRIHGKGKGA